MSSNKKALGHKKMHSSYFYANPTKIPAYSNNLYQLFKRFKLNNFPYVSLTLHSESHVFPFCLFTLSSRSFLADSLMNLTWVVVFNCKISIAITYFSIFLANKKILQVLMFVCGFGVDGKKNYLMHSPRSLNYGLNM